MGRIGFSLDVENATDDEENIYEIKVDVGGGEILLVPYVSTSGFDTPPLDGDYVAMIDNLGDDTATAVSTADPLYEPQAEKGELRLYGRDNEGAEVNYFWFKQDGIVELNGDVNAMLKGEAFLTQLEIFLTAVENGTKTVGTPPQNAAALTAIGAAATAFKATLDQLLSETLKTD